MTIAQEVPVEERLVELLHNLGLTRAHFAGRDPSDFKGLATCYPEVISSLTLICPQGLDARHFQTVASRFLIFRGDQGVLGELLETASRLLPSAQSVPLPHYFAPVWADVVADHADTLLSTMLIFWMDASLSPIYPMLKPKVKSRTFPIACRGLARPWCCCP